ncbi:cytochrome P450 [Microcoleus sp. ZQ-A2]|nr:cytochrome P450 [Microcoleus sp. FACHB-1]
MMSQSPVQISQPFKFNPYEPEYRNNIYEIYDYMRSHEPVHQELFKQWYLTRYTDVKAVLQEPGFQEVPIPEIISNKSRYLHHKGKNLDALVKSVDQWLFFTAPPEHTRLRTLVSKAFKLQNFQHKPFQIQEIANKLISQIKQQESLDVILDFAEQLPAQATAQILGLPNEDSELLLHWSKPLAHTLDAFASLKICSTLNQIALESTAALARIQLPIAINTLVQHISNLRLATEKLEYHNYLILRHLKSLPLVFSG